MQCNASGRRLFWLIKHKIELQQSADKTNLEPQSGIRLSIDIQREIDTRNNQCKIDTMIMHTYILTQITHRQTQTEQQTQCTGLKRASAQESEWLWNPQQTQSLQVTQL